MPLHLQSLGEGWKLEPPPRGEAWICPESGEGLGGGGGRRVAKPALSAHWSVCFSPCIFASGTGPGVGASSTPHHHRGLGGGDLGTPSPKPENDISQKDHAPAAVVPGPRLCPGLCKSLFYFGKNSGHNQH